MISRQFREPEPAPSQVDPRDLAFFRDHPARHYRARAPFRSELKQARRQGMDLTLSAGQELAVIVSRIGAGIITTMLVKVRLDRPGAFPDTDDDITRGFPKLPRPTAPAGVPA